MNFLVKGLDLKIKPKDEFYTSKILKLRRKLLFKWDKIPINILKINQIVKKNRFYLPINNQENWVKRWLADHKNDKDRKWILNISLIDNLKILLVNNS